MEDSLLQCILSLNTKSALRIINDSYINFVSCLDTAALLDQKDVVLSILKHSKVNCSGLLMEELLNKKLFDMALLFIENKRLWGSAASVFIYGDNTIEYPNQNEFLEWREKHITLNKI